MCANPPIRHPQGKISRFPTYRYRHWHSRRHSSRTLDGVSPLGPCGRKRRPRTAPTCPVSLSERNQFQNLIAGAKWQVFSEGGNAESLSCFSSFSIVEKSGGMDSSLPAYTPIPNVLTAFPTPSSIAIVCNSSSSFPCAAYTKRKCFSGKSKKCFWIIKRTKFLTLSGLTLSLQVGTSVKDIGRLGYACQTREPSP